jgi:hypothetical protein
MAKQQIEQMALSKTFFIKAGLGELFFILFRIVVKHFCLFCLKNQAWHTAMFSDFLSDRNGYLQDMRAITLCGF